MASGRISLFYFLVLLLFLFFFQIYISLPLPLPLLSFSFFFLAVFVMCSFFLFEIPMNPQEVADDIMSASVGLKEET